MQSDTTEEAEATPTQTIGIQAGARKEVTPYVPNDIFSENLDSAFFSEEVLNKRNGELRKSFTGVDGAATKAGHEKQFVTGYDLFQVAHPIHNQEYLIEMYNNDYTHYAAVQAKVANVVGLGYDLIESPKTMEKEDDIDDDTDKIQSFRKRLARARRQMFDRLDSFNEEDEFMETLHKVVIDYEVTGNGYLEVGRTKSGNIGYIGHIPAHTLRVRLQRDGFVQFINGKPIFFRRYGDLKTRNPFASDTSPNEIIHFKNYNPKDNYYGSPDIIPALIAVAGNRFADQYNLDYFENKAVPRNLIIVRGGEFSEDQQRKLLRFFGEDLRGSHHRALYVPLPPDTKDQKHDVEIRSVEAGTQDSAFKEYTRGNMEKILLAHRVPASKLGMVGSSGSLAAAKDLDKTFKEQVCRPLQKVLEKKLNRVVEELTDLFKFKLNELDLVDEVAQSSIDSAEHAMGVVTANEIRARKGRSGLKNGDRTIFDINEEAVAVAAAQAEKQAKAAGATAAKAGAVKSEAKTQGTNGSRARDVKRVTARTDSVGAARNPKGEGRTYG